MTAWSPAQIQMRLKRVGEAQHDGAVRGLLDAVDHIKQVAMSRVPHEEGTLERSAVASVDAETLTGAVSFDTPYAVRQHEDMTLAHDEGRQAKYLETAMHSERDVVRRLIADGIRGKIQTEAR